MDPQLAVWPLPLHAVHMRNAVNHLYMDLPTLCVCRADVKESTCQQESKSHPCDLAHHGLKERAYDRSHIIIQSQHDDEEGVVIHFQSQPDCPIIRP